VDRRLPETPQEPAEGGKILSRRTEGIHEGRGDDDPVGPGLAEEANVSRSAHPKADGHRDG
jgi:hypothetical protein